MRSIRQLGKKKVDLNQISDFYKLQEYNAYRVITEEVDYSGVLEELQYETNSTLGTDYYIKNRDKYKEDRPYIVALNLYINEHREQLMQQVSLNERSFEIWGREKFLQKEDGKRILKNLGLSPETLNIYQTTEPLPYYAHHKNVPQNVLILENKDTFYSMRRHLLQGNTQILGVKIFIGPFKILLTVWSPIYQIPAIQSYILGI